MYVEFNLKPIIVPAPIGIGREGPERINILVSRELIF